MGKKSKNWLWPIFSLALGVASWYASSGTTIHAGQEDASPDYRTWGEDHVGQELPEYTTGTECLFCHRDYVAPRWRMNAHNRTMRLAEPDDPAMKSIHQDADRQTIARETEILLGAHQIVRYMKKLPGYGEAAISGELWNGAHPSIRDADRAGWHLQKFNEKCAGCHATAIDPSTASFGSPSLDCYVCHGVLELEHAQQTDQTLFAKKHADDPRVVTSVCGQCHLRGGRSKSSGRPFPTLFVAGDNLFRDFEVDWSDEALVQMDRVDRHIFENARDVMTRSSTTTCATCHSVHGESSSKHQELSVDQSCEVCHPPGKPWSEVDWPKDRKSKTCEYP
jgi:hypothetical protein